MDLLTVVEHEYGHVLGLPDVNPATQPGSLMAATLPVGVRRSPTTLVRDLRVCRGFTEFEVRERQSPPDAACGLADC